MVRSWRGLSFWLANGCLLALFSPYGQRKTNRQGRKGWRKRVKEEIIEEEKDKTEGGENALLFL
jgi:hypothetical protein